MANEYGSAQERGEAGNNTVPRQGGDIGLNYDKLPVPNGEIGSVDSAGMRPSRSR